MVSNMGTYLAAFFSHLIDKGSKASTLKSYLIDYEHILYSFYLIRNNAFGAATSEKVVTM